MHQNLLEAHRAFPDEDAIWTELRQARGELKRAYLEDMRARS
jgi:hypothetical protein